MLYHVHAWVFTSGLNKFQYIWIVFLVFFTTLNNIEIILWMSVLLVEEIELPRDNRIMNLSVSSQLTNFINYICIKCTTSIGPNIYGNLSCRKFKKTKYASFFVCVFVRLCCDIFTDILYPLLSWLLCPLVSINWLKFECMASMNIQTMWQIYRPVNCMTNENKQQGGKEDRSGQ